MAGLPESLKSLSARFQWLSNSPALIIGILILLMFYVSQCSKESARNEMLLKENKAMLDTLYQQDKVIEDISDKLRRSSEKAETVYVQSLKKIVKHDSVFVASVIDSVKDHIPDSLKNKLDEAIGQLKAEIRMQNESLLYADQLVARLRAEITNDKHSLEVKDQIIKSLQDQAELLKKKKHNTKFFLGVGVGVGLTLLLTQ